MILKPSYVSTDSICLPLLESLHPQIFNKVNHCELNHIIIFLYVSVCLFYTIRSSQLVNCELPSYTPLPHSVSFKLVIHISTACDSASFPTSCISPAYEQIFESVFGSTLHHNEIHLRLPLSSKQLLFFSLSLFPVMCPVDSIASLVSGSWMPADDL